MTDNRQQDHRASDPTSFYERDTSQLPPMRPEDMPQPSFGELWSAGATIARGERVQAPRERLDAAYVPILEVLQREEPVSAVETYLAMGQPKRRRWWAALPRDSGMKLTPAAEDIVWKEIARRRAIDPKFLPGVPATIDEFHDQIVKRESEERERARAVQARNHSFTGSVAGFLGGAAASADDPVTIATLPAGGFGKNLLTRVLTEGMAQGGVQALAEPGLVSRRAELGEDTSFGQMMGDIGGAALAGAGFQGLLVEPIGALARKVIGPGRMTEAETGAVNVLQREAEIEAISPFQPGAGTEAHKARMDREMTALATGAPAEAPTIGAGRAARDQFMARVRGAESGGNDAARNARSSATGRYQFTDGTWLRYHRRVVGGEMSDAQRLAQRGDGAVQDRLMQVLTNDNAAALARIGAPETAGNLYLMHFAGQGGASKILRAAPDTPIEQVLTKEAIAANPFLRGKSAGAVVEWAHGKMGETPHAGPVLRRDQFDEGGAGDAEWAAAQREVEAAEAEWTALQREMAGDGDPHLIGSAEPVRLDVAEGELLGRNLEPADMPESRPADDLAEPEQIEQAAPLDPDAPIDPRAEPKGQDWEPLERPIEAQPPRALSAATAPDPAAYAALPDAERSVADGVWDDQIAAGAEPAPLTLVYARGGPEEGRLIGYGTEGRAAAETWAREKGMDVDLAEVAPPRAIAELGAARAQAARTGSAAASPKFDDPFEGEGAARTTESLEHDVRILAEAEPGRLVALGEGDSIQSVRLDDLLQDLDDDVAAIEVARSCL